VVAKTEAADGGQTAGPAT